MSTSLILSSRRTRSGLVKGMAATLLALGLAATVAAAPADQAGSRPDQLTAAEVQALVEHAATPADHTALGAHFMALAEKYAADAREHQALAAAYRKNPSASETKRPGAPDTAVHCTRFAQLAGSAAKEARALAALHTAMASAR